MHLSLRLERLSLAEAGYRTANSGLGIPQDLGMQPEEGNVLREGPSQGIAPCSPAP